MVAELLIDLLMRGVPIRIIVLKARQLGISTLVEAFIFWLCYTRSQRKAVIIAHEQKASENLYSMFKRYHKNMPLELQHTTEHSNMKKLSFAKMESEVLVYTAGTGDNTGRSDTNQILHISELAFWDNAEVTLNALVKTVAYLPGTVIIKESTANGLSGQFYNDWKRAKAGKGNYIPLFFAWFQNPEYSMPFDSEAQKDAFKLSLTENEKQLMKTYKVNLEQLNWRRNAIEDECGGDESLFFQEYPSNDIECFLTTGRPVFNRNRVDMFYKMAEELEIAEPPIRGNLEWTYNGEEISGVQFVEAEEGYITIYDASVIDNISTTDYNRFVGGWDVAEGLEQGDYSYGCYMDRGTMNVFLEWHGHIDTDKLAEEQAKISCLLEKKDIICTERNSPGLSTITHAENWGLNQFRERSYVKGKDYKFVPHDLTGKTGFYTTETTKQVITDRLNEYIREFYFFHPGKEFWDECSTFVYDARGHRGAQGKRKNPGIRCFDDRVMGTALMLECHNGADEFMQRIIPAHTVEYKPILSETQKKVGYADFL